MSIDVSKSIDLSPVQQAANALERAQGRADYWRGQLWDRIVEAHAAGTSVRELARQSDLSTQAIYQHLSERNRT